MTGAPGGPGPVPAPAAVGAPVLVRLGPADAGEVLVLQRAAYVTEAVRHGDLTLPPLHETLEGVEADLSDPRLTGHGLRLGTATAPPGAAPGRLVGSIRARVEAGDPTRAVLSRLAVAPDLRGRGFGTALLDAAVAGLPAAVATVALFTGSLSTPNLRLYARLGWRETRREPWRDYELVHLERALPPR